MEWWIVISSFIFCNKKISVLMYFKLHLYCKSYMTSEYTKEFLLILKVKLNLSLTYPGIPDKNEKGQENWKDVFKCVTLCIRTAQNVWHFVEMLYFSCTRCWKSNGRRSKRRNGAWTICHRYELKKYRIHPDAAQTVWCNHFSLPYQQILTQSWRCLLRKRSESSYRWCLGIWISKWK